MLKKGLDIPSPGVTPYLSRADNTDESEHQLLLPTLLLIYFVTPGKPFLLHPSASLLVK